MALEGSEESLQDLPLPALFARARDILRQLESAPSMAPATQRLVAEGAACLRTAAAAADAAALFSPNEERDDLATADIKYLLLPFYQAEVAGYTHAEDPSVRLGALTAAGQQYRAFLHRCRQYDLLSPPAAALAQAALGSGQGEGEGDARGGGGGGDGARLDPASLRQHKIEKFKREKAIKARVAELEARLQRLDAAGGDGGGAGGDAEEAQRELWMLQVDLAALQAAERCGTVLQELQILRHAAALPPDQRERQREQRAASGPPPDLMRQLAAAAGNLGLGGSAAAAKREQLAAGVFRPSHALPTMSVEQFGELEYRRMLEQQQREAAAREQAERQRALRSADDLEEEAVQRQRAWDEFRDDNPRGWGNRKGRG